MPTLIQTTMPGFEQSGDSGEIEMTDEQYEHLRAMNALLSKESQSKAAA